MKNLPVCGQPDSSVIEEPVLHRFAMEELADPDLKLPAARNPAVGCASAMVLKAPRQFDCAPSTPSLFKKKKGVGCQTARPYRGFLAFIVYSIACPSVADPGNDLHENSELGIGAGH